MPCSPIKTGVTDCSRLPRWYCDRKLMQMLSGLPKDSKALAAAFAAARYVVEAGPAPIVVRIGDCAPSLDGLFNQRRWAIVTAHNPGGSRRNARCNESANRQLLAELRSLAPAHLLPVCNRDPHGLWPDEPGWVFTPESDSQVDRLARRFSQRAVVIGNPGQPAELRFYDNAGGPIRCDAPTVAS